MWCRVAFRLVATLIAALLSAGGTLAQEKRFALLIGNQAYDASVGVLKNPHNDIALVAQSLEKQGFAILPPLKDARRSAILGAVRDLTRRLTVAGSGAVGFLYYSGHGAAEKDTNTNYIIPVDAKDPGSVAFWDDSVKLDDIMRLLDGARGAVKFVVFDACRNELQLPTRDTSKGLVPVAEQQGFFVAYASAPGRTASDRGATSGPYAAALAKELGRQGLDHLNLFQNVKETVIASTGGTQHPWESNGLTRRVYLTGEPTTPADVALWESVRTTGDQAALQRYLDRFPSGVFASTALQMIERLKAEDAQRLAAQQFEIERKAQEGKLAEELRRALDEARRTQEALTKAEQQRIAAAAREEDLRKAQQVLLANPASTGEQSAADRSAAAALALRAQAAAEETRTTREALEAAEAKRKESEVRLAALEKAEQDRQAALEIIRKTDVASAKRAAIDAQAVFKVNDEMRQRREIQLSQQFSLNDQCSWLTPPVIEIVDKPKFGAIVVRDGQITATSIFAKNRQHCLGSKGRGRTIFYVLDEKHKDRTDGDAVTLRVRHTGGIVDTHEFQIDLDQRAATRTKITRRQ